MNDRGRCLVGVGDVQRIVQGRAVFVRFSLGGQSFDWRLATIAGMEVAKLVPWNSLLN